VEEVTRVCRGRVVKFQADNAFVTFASVRAAVAAAIRVNELVAERNVEAAPENRIDVAIGIGFGPILLADHDFFGDEVNWRPSSAKISPVMGRFF